MARVIPNHQESSQPVSRHLTCHSMSIASVSQRDIPPSTSWVGSKGVNTYIPKFYFDSTNSNQCILKLGTFLNECNDKPIATNFSICYI